MKKRCLQLGVLLFAAGLVAGLLDRLFPPLLAPDPDSFAQVVVDRDGGLLRAFPDATGIWRYASALDDIDPKYVEALLAYEDRWYWHHPGINPGSLLRATLQNLAAGRTVSGGSTVTMQTARLLYDHPRTLPGKLQQALRALQLEWHLSKQDILALYINLAPFGGTLEGVKAASLAYFGQDPRYLTHAQAALLAVLPQAPSRLRPDRHVTRAQAARDKVLRRIAQFGVWNEETVVQALAEPVIARSPRAPLKAPLLARRLAREQAGEAVVASTIDGHIQADVEAYAAQARHQLHDRGSLAFLVVDNQSREVLGYVGSADFLDDNRSGHVDMVQATRSPGSTLKPLLFALAVDEGMIHSQSLLIDAPRHSGYRPQNFSQRFRGPVTATTALRESLNVPAVDLLDSFGPERFAARLEHVGLRLKIAGGKPNLSLILGGAGLQLQHLVAAYAALATDGIAKPLKLVARSTEGPHAQRRLVSPGAAWIVSRMMMSDGILFGNEPGWSWKTGTSYGFRDAWAIGYNARYSVGVWTGRPDGTPVPGRYGRNTAAPMLFDLMRRLPAPRSVTAMPTSVSKAEICWPSGMAASDQPGDWCHRRFTAWVLDESIPPTLPDPNDPEPLLVRYWQDATTGSRVGTLCQSGMAIEAKRAVWPRRSEAWLPPGWRRSSLVPPLAEQCAGTAVPVRALRFEGLEDGQVFRARNSPLVTLSASGGQGVYRWYVDGEHQRTADAGDRVTYQFSAQGRRQILVMDEIGNAARAEVQVVW